MRTLRSGTMIDLVWFEPGHGEALMSWFYDFRYRAFFREFSDHPLSLDECRNMRATMERSGQGFVTIIDKATGEPIGLMQFGVLKRKAGVFRWGIMLDEKFQGGTRAIEAIIILLAYLFEYRACQKPVVEFLDRDKHICRITEQGGFTREGVLVREALVDGEYLDEVRYYLPKETFYELYGGYVEELDKLPENQ